MLSKWDFPNRYSYDDEESRIQDDFDRFLIQDTDDADVFLQFPILIRILDLISVPNHSRDSFILIKFNTFSSWREIVSVHSS